MTTTCLDAALSYAGDFGWEVFPCHSVQDGVCTCRKGKGCSEPGKHPRTRHGHQDATTDAKDIGAWWRCYPTANVAIRTGQASDIIVLDIDPRHGGDDSLQSLQDRLGPLPEHPVAETGGGGTHRLFKHPGDRVAGRQAIMPGIDIRGDGNYIVAPVSVHQSGRRYRWRKDAAEVGPPNLPYPWLFFLPTPNAHRDIDTQRHRTSSARVPGVSGGLGGLRDCCSVEEALQKALLATLPTGPGQRHDLLFRFARYLKSYPAFAQAPVSSMQPYVREWYTAATQFTRTQPFEDFWFDFAEGWDKVTTPMGTGAMKDMIERAKVATPPARAAKEYTHPQLLCLICLCRELQVQAGDSPFYLSIRTAGEAVGISARTAATWLNGLVVDRYLIREKAADKSKRKAAFYRYTGD